LTTTITIQKSILFKFVSKQIWFFIDFIISLSVWKQCFICFSAREVRNCQGKSKIILISYNYFIFSPALASVVQDITWHLLLCFKNFLIFSYLLNFWFEMTINEYLWFAKFYKDKNWTMILKQNLFQRKLFWKMFIFIV